MTAITPGREELLALAEKIVDASFNTPTCRKLKGDKREMVVTILTDELSKVVLRLAAKPADDVREALVLAQAAISAAIELHKPDPAGLLLTALNKVDRALSLTGAPKP